MMTNLLNTLYAAPILLTLYFYFFDTKKLLKNLKECYLCKN